MLIQDPWSPNGLSLTHGLITLDGLMICYKQSFDVGLLTLAAYEFANIHFVDILQYII